MGGASALNDLLAELPDSGLRVLVVWEPVLKTDLAPPVTPVLRRLSDRRVTQFWDPRRVLSAELVRQVNTDPARYGFADPLDSEFIVWDVVAVFARDAQWDKGLPVPVYYGGPVLDF